jgi:hypothetical protein
LKKRHLLLAAGLIVGLLYILRKNPPSDIAPATPVSGTRSTDFVAEPLPGEKILATYATEATTPEEDLTWMSRLCENYNLIAKSQPLPLGSNAEIAAALRGEGRSKLAVLPPQHRAFDSAGRLIDRWGSPLFFHAESAQKLDIRSAGPDREMWTPDDLQRNATGQFRRGPDLNPPSLLAPEMAPTK